MGIVACVFRTAFRFLPAERIRVSVWLVATTSSVFRKSRRGGARARRAPLHPRRAPYGRHWKDFALRPEKGLIVVGGRLRAPSNYIFPVKTFAIGGHQTIAKGAFGAQGGPWPSGPPAYAPDYNCFTYLLY